MNSFEIWSNQQIDNFCFQNFVGRIYTMSCKALAVLWRIKFKIRRYINEI